MKKSLLVNGKRYMAVSVVGDTVKVDINPHCRMYRSLYYFGPQRMSRYRSLGLSYVGGVNHRSVGIFAYYFLTGRLNIDETECL